jgi:hypothetical protein
MNENEAKIISIIDEMKETTVASHFISLKRQVEAVIRKLPKANRKEWEDKLQEIKKPTSKAERQLIQEPSGSTNDVNVTSNATEILTQQTERMKKTDSVPVITQHFQEQSLQASTTLLSSPPALDEPISSEDIEEAKKKRIAKLKSKAKKVRVEDTHTRKTYLVRNDLLQRMDKVSNGTHGFKIEFINFAIELALVEYEIDDENES